MMDQHERSRGSIPARLCYTTEVPGNLEGFPYCSLIMSDAVVCLFPKSCGFFLGGKGSSCVASCPGMAFDLILDPAFGR